MGTEGGIVWDNPELRAVIPLDAFHMSRKLRSCIRRGDFQITADRQFRSVLQACARADSTWITEDIRNIHMSLHEQGHAHSIEVWKNAALAGGLYGIAIGGAFFGESMFTLERNASKVALAYLVDHLANSGFMLLDAQYMTPHLASLGAVGLSRNAYLRSLAAALELPVSFAACSIPASSSSVLQRISQTS